MTSAGEFGPVGSVRHNIARMRGVWHDHLEAFHPDGTPMPMDEVGSVTGPYPYDNLVYIDFDGENLVQTNVTFRGRPLHSRTFTGKIIDNVLHFDRLGPKDPGHIGMSGGPGVLYFMPATVGDHLIAYTEPDIIHLHGTAGRTRTTVLYRNGRPLRTMFVRGTRIAPTAEKRLHWDPRGVEGDVHEDRSVTQAFTSADATD